MSGIFMFEAFFCLKITQNLHQGFITKLLFRGVSEEKARGDNF